MACGPPFALVPWTPQNLGANLYFTMASCCCFLNIFPKQNSDYIITCLKAFDDDYCSILGSRWLCLFVHYSEFDEADSLKKCQKKRQGQPRAGKGAAHCSELPGDAERTEARTTWRLAVRASSRDGGSSCRQRVGKPKASLW